MVKIAFQDLTNSSQEKTNVPPANISSQPQELSRAEVIAKIAKTGGTAVAAFQLGRTILFVIVIIAILIFLMVSKYIPWFLGVFFILFAILMLILEIKRLKRIASTKL